MGKKPMILDGAMGTLLQAAGMPLGGFPDVFGADHPEIVERIHREYVDAGSEVIYANTFGSNARKLARTGRDPGELIRTNMETAKRAAGTSAKVAMDIGPVGELLRPLGTLSFEEAYECYRQMAVAGERAGADLIVIETFTDLQDARAALLAAKENTGLPVWVTMSFEKNGRTFTGTTVSAAALTLSGLGADAVGINCSLGPEEILPLAREMAKWTDRPLVIKPNAGLPDPATGEYGLGAEEFADRMERFLPLGILAMGGCCGTDPSFIRKLSGLPCGAYGTEKTERRNGVCSASRTVEYGPVHIVGERLNPTGKKRLQQALKEHDLDYVSRLAVDQADAGAEILDVNCGIPEFDERAAMRDVVEAVQTVTDLPLQIDTVNPDVLEAGLRSFAGKAIVNSVNGKEESLRTVLPVVKKYGAAVVALCLDEDGIPQTAEKRLEVAEKIVRRAAGYGIPAEDILVDTMTLTVAAQQDQAAETLEALREARERFGVHATLGVSNISFGLPQREHIARAFLAEALCCGLDFPIINPNQTGMTGTVVAHRALTGEDDRCDAYVRYFSEHEQENVRREAPELTIEESIRKGLRDETAALAESMLREMDENELIERHLIPALNAVGDGYEKGTLFLPQLINAANAACAAFDLIRVRIAGKGKSISRGKIVLATVRGDVHDIGKNIVKVVLENYGFTVIDLGRDVPKETVVETVLREDIRLVGLSALMTTTVASMKETIEALRDSGAACRVMVGGAVLTEEYAMEIGADYYAKDAQQSVRIAEEVLG